MGCIYGEEMFGTSNSAKKKGKKGGKKGGGRVSPISFVKYPSIDRDDGTKEPYFEDFGNLYFMMLAISPHCKESHSSIQAVNLKSVAG
jgi:hypothetical protein